MTSSLTQPAHLHTGRGGVGNSFTPRPNTTVVSRAPASLSRSPFSSGIGGAGNIHNASERAMFSFDEEMAREAAIEAHAAPVYHIGRGGAGNWAVADDRPRSTVGEFGSTRPSHDSAGADLSKRSMETGTGRDSGLWKRMSQSVSHRSS
ncbi:MAG: hypothetical protein M1829_002236 [Trizodia sp. TS-e1964]|nr:MAG: hypothetical protein M1829_002236 [Trizodia sp. TS-e1964]